VLTGERASAFDLFGPACERAWRSAAFSTAASDCELVVDSAATQGQAQNQSSERLVASH
jgi:hypothetical protein